MVLLTLLMACETSEDLRQQANLFEGAQKYQEAIELLNRAIELDDENLKALLDRGVDHSILSEYSLAIKDYSRVIELDADNQLAYLNRAKNYKKLGNWELALNDLITVQNIVNNDKTMEHEGIIGYMDERLDGPLADEDVIYDITVEEVLYEKVLALYELEQFEEAYQDIIQFEKTAYDTLIRLKRGVLKVQLFSDSTGCQDIADAYYDGCKSAKTEFERLCN